MCILYENESQNAAIQDSGIERVRAPGELNFKEKKVRFSEGVERSVSYQGDALAGINSLTDSPTKSSSIKDSNDI
jgi:hypothetical protein